MKTITIKESEYITLNTKDCILFYREYLKPSLFKFRLSPIETVVLVFSNFKVRIVFSGFVELSNFVDKLKNVIE